MTPREPAAPRQWPFGPMTLGAVHAFAVLAVITFALAALNFYWTAREVNAANARARALCAFDAHLGAAPLIPAPGHDRPSLLGVQIVSDARVAWRQAGCQGRLPPPDPSFTHWARAYHLPAG